MGRQQSEHHGLTFRKIDHDEKETERCVLEIRGRRKAGSSACLCLSKCFCQVSSYSRSIELGILRIVIDSDELNARYY
jgi:hypothetical protein